MKLYDIDRLDDSEAKVAFAKATDSKQFAVPWLMIRLLLAIGLPGLIGIWILVGLLF